MRLFGCWNCGTTFREHRNYRRTHTFKAAIDFPFIWILFQQFSSVFFWIWLLFLRRKFPGDFANSALLTLPPPRPSFSSSFRFLHKIFTTLFSSSCWAEIGDHLGEPRLAVDSATAGYFPNPTTDRRGQTGVTPFPENSSPALFPKLAKIAFLLFRGRRKLRFSFP